VSAAPEPAPADMLSIGGCPAPASRGGPFWRRPRCAWAVDETTPRRRVAGA